MAYSTLDDLKKYMSEEVIISLTDDRDLNQVDTLVVTDAIAQADTFIDGFLRGRYPVEIPEEDVPSQISDISTKCAAYNLYRRRMATTMPEALSRDYKMCVKALEKIQKGEISPFPIESEPIVVKSNKTAYSKIYNKSVWEGYGC